MGLSLDQQIAQLASEGCPEIAVIQLPSQAKRKRRKPSKRRSTKTNAVASVDYSPAMSRVSPRATNRAKSQHKSDRVDFIIRGSAT